MNARSDGIDSRHFECFCGMQWSKNVSKTSLPTPRQFECFCVMKWNKNVSRTFLATKTSRYYFKFSKLAFSKLKITRSDGSGGRSDGTNGRSDEIDTRHFECFCVMQWSKNVSRTFLATKTSRYYFKF